MNIKSVKEHITISNIIKYALPVFATIISCISLYQSNRSNKISMDNLDLNIKPIIHTKFEFNESQKRYSLKIYNDGARPVYNLYIQNYGRLFNIDSKTTVIGMYPENKTLISHKLESGDSLQFPIRYSSLKESVQLYKTDLIKSEDSFIALQTYYLSYLRHPDNVKFKKFKYLFLFNTSSSIEFSYIDPDRGYNDYFLRVKEIIENNDMRYTNF